MYISIIHPSSSGPHSKCIHFPPRDGGVARQRGSLLSSFSNKVFLSFSIFFFYFPPREREKNVRGLLSYCTLSSIQSNWFNASHLLSQGLLFNAIKNFSCFVLDSKNLRAERKESSPGLFNIFYQHECSPSTQCWIMDIVFQCVNLCHMPLSWAKPRII